MLLFIASGMIAVCTYLFLIIALVFILLDSQPTHYSSFKESTISLNAINIDAIITQEPTPVPTKEQAAIPNNSLAGSGIKNMFEKIDQDQISRDQPIGDNRKQTEQNIKNKKLQELQNASQDIQNKLNSLSNLTITTESTQGDGKYDEWYAQIEKILYRQWQQTFFSDKQLTAIIHIKITASGVFSYKVIQYSSDLAFDNSLKTMLEQCTKMQFPPHPKGTKEIAITFKD